jgi:hypothetical protein
MAPGDKKFGVVDVAKDGEYLSCFKRGSAEQRDIRSDIASNISVEKQQ